MPFGLWEKLPATAKVAWGARAIVSVNHACAAKRYNVELLWDRQDWFGTEAERTALSTKLNAGSLKKALGSFEYALATGLLRCDGREEINLEINGIYFAASCKASHGYLYIIAWEEREEESNATDEG